MSDDRKEPYVAHETIANGMLVEGPGEIKTAFQHDHSAIRYADDLNIAYAQGRQSLLSEVEAAKELFYEAANQIYSEWGGKNGMIGWAGPWYEKYEAWLKRNGGQ